MQAVDLSQIRRLLFETTVKAGKAALAAQSTTTVVKDGIGGGGITTRADLMVQKIVVSALQKAYPEITIVGEEGNTLIVTPKQCFIADPIDGSAEYWAGGGNWTSTIAYQGPEGSVGIIYQPHMGLLYEVQGDCVTLWQEPLEGGVFKCVKQLKAIAPRKPRWRICMPIEQTFSHEVLANIFMPIIEDKDVRQPVSVACNTVHLLYLFNGSVDAMIMWAKIWDAAAAIPMAKALGITVTDFNGNEPDLSIIEPQRLIFARGQEVLDCIVSRTKHWPYDGTEIRPKPKQ